MEEEKDVAAGDIFQIILIVEAQRLSNFCSSNTYPFLKMEGWYILVYTENILLFSQQFSFDELKKQFEFKYRHDRAGKYGFTVKLMPDCYFGLDIEK